MLTKMCQEDHHLQHLSLRQGDRNVPVVRVTHSGLARRRTVSLRRKLTLPLLVVALVSCSEPPPPVADFILERVTTELATVALGGSSAEVVVASVPGGFFQNTARPVMGRPFAGEDHSRSPTVCLISYSLWERFGSGESAAPLIIGTMSLEVIGVMPDHFDIPAGTEVWIPK
jgi:MacB-like protein